MTIDTYREYLDRLALIDYSGVSFRVRITDIRSAFGRTDARIVPIAGDGAKWVDFSRLILIEKEVV